MDVTRLVKVGSRADHVTVTNGLVRPKADGLAVFTLSLGDQSVMRAEQRLALGEED